MDGAKQEELLRDGGYGFGPFVADAVKRTLSRDGRAVPITSKTFDVLLVLLDHRDRVVSKEELLNSVWPDTAVNENNLVRQISSLRRALGQRPDQHDFIVTIPGHGYRFVASAWPLSTTLDRLSEPDVRTDVVSALVPHPEDSGHADAPPDTVSVPAPRLVDAVLPAPSRSVPRRWLFGMVIGAIAAGVSLGVVGARLLRSGDQERPARTLQRVTYDEATLPRDASWAPDGRSIVYASDRAGNADLWKQRLGDPDPVRLTTSEANESQPQWSPDGRWIVFRSERADGGLYIMPADGGAERMVASFGYEPRWSPDATLILFKRTTVLPDLPSIYVVGLDGRPPRPVRPDVLGQFTAVHVAWHPDGRRISAWGTTGAPGVRFVTVPLGAGSAAAPQIPEKVQRDLAGVLPGRFIWARSRRYIYFEARAGDAQNVWRLTIDPLTENWLTGPERLTTGAGEDTNMALSPDGARLVFTTTSSRTRLWAFPLDAAAGQLTGEPHPITDGSTGEVDFDARGDGTKLAYRTVRAGRNELWERSIVEGRERLLLASTDARIFKPRWSPDGARLAFSRCVGSDNRLALGVLDADGGGARLLTTPSQVDMQGFDWSKDGKAILGSCRFNPSERYATCLASISRTADGAESSIRVIASDPKRNLYNQRFSPDQRWITFLAHDLAYASTSAVYVIPAAGGSWQAITDGSWFDDKPRWGPDGRILYFVSNRSGVANVWGRRFDTATGLPIGDPFRVTSFQSARFVLTPRTVQMDIAVTATHLLLPMTEARSEIWMLDQIDR